MIAWRSEAIERRVVTLNDSDGVDAPRRDSFAHFKDTEGARHCSTASLRKHATAATRNVLRNAARGVVELALQRRPAALGAVATRPRRVGAAARVAPLERSGAPAAERKAALRAQPLARLALVLKRQ